MRRHAVAGLLVALLPLSSTAWAQTSSAVTLQAYPCPAGNADGWAMALKSQYQGTAGVRIAADPRGGQVLVEAPPAIHAQIAQHLPQLSQSQPQPAPAARSAVHGGPAAETPAPSQPQWQPQAHPAAPPTAPLGPQAPVASPSRSVSHAPANAAQPAEPVRSYSVSLTVLSSRQFDDAVTRILGKRVTAIAPPAPTVRSLAVQSTGGAARLDVDYQTNRVSVAGPASAVDGLARMIHALDQRPAAAGQQTEMVALDRATKDTIHRTAAAMAVSNTARAAQTSAPPAVAPVSMLLQQPGPPGQFEEEMPPGGVPEVPSEVPPEGPPGVPFEVPPGAPFEVPPGMPPEGVPEGQPTNGENAGPGLVGSVQVELIPGLDVIILKGDKRDVEQMRALIEQIEQYSAVTEPEIVVYHMRHVDCSAMAELIVPLYEEIFTARRGEVSTTALVKPNALLLIGRKEAVQTLIDLVKRLDRPVLPNTQFHVFRLRHAAALTAQTTLLDFYLPREGLAARVQVVADYRTNTLIVQASPRDLKEVAALIDRIDTDGSEAVDELRVFRLQNTLADDLAPILQSAITGEGAPGQAAALAGEKSTRLRFITINPRGEQKLESGILTGVRITSDARSNALLVSAPAESMGLIAALIAQLDTLPVAEAQIKVFTIVNGDASALVDVLGQLFPSAPTTGAVAAAAALGVELGSITGESSVISLRFAVDTRTNSIIATGTPADLTVVESILLRLDDGDIRNRKSIVYRLKNAPAIDVSNSLNQFLTSRRAVEQITPGLLSPFEQIEREVVIVPEPVSNSLIVSATPRFFDEIKAIVEELDQRPPMVLIQVLLAAVDLNKTDEFGVELGLQDQVLFDRSLLENIVTVSQTIFDPNGNPVSTNEEIASATFTPGFAFNNQPLGQSSDPETSNIVGSQGISSFALGRTNNELGYGGLVLSASSESVSVLIRALAESRRLDVLSRPQIMTLDNQPAFIQVGQRVPRITGTQLNETGQINNITLENTGLILGVTPRISPDGLVVMEIDAERSEVGPEAEGIPVSISATGQVVRSPRIDTITAQTTVSAASGQTIILGGLISTNKQQFHRKVPWLGDIPIIGFAFRYDGERNERSELLIIMTPHIVRSEADAERLKRIESARMHWCLGDVLVVHGDGHLREQRSGDWKDSETPVIYPDLDPMGKAPPTVPCEDASSGMLPGGIELVPTPAGGNVEMIVPSTVPMAPPMPTTAPPAPGMPAVPPAGTPLPPPLEPPPEPVSLIPATGPPHQATRFPAINGASAGAYAAPTDRAGMGGGPVALPGVRPAEYQQATRLPATAESTVFYGPTAYGSPATASQPVVQPLPPTTNASATAPPQNSATAPVSVYRPHQAPVRQY